MKTLIIIILAVTIQAEANKHCEDRYKAQKRMATDLKQNPAMTFDQYEKTHLLNRAPISYEDNFDLVKAQITEAKKSNEPIDLYMKSKLKSNLTACQLENQ
jgi:hypothetical protein